ncbi:MAG: HTH domain-containing protein [Candidatus Humimicrobiaceae bacterium]
MIDKIKNSKNFTIKTLSKEFKVTDKTIERDLEILKKENKIVFTGNKKSGYWKLIE